ncbi:ubiquitin-conjugating enzyme E2 J2-like [Watersipora subatra]|uniref:ubiquitin-conjugating enzyme E2 J2-like n=1 Tax=Watersipora subatra TaxID=2589382 RepID=UPI00355BCA32
MTARNNRRTSAPTTASLRLRQDYMRLMKDPVPYIVAAPKQDNILEWHYVVTGPVDSPYEGGYYHGKLIFPQQYPFKPPSILMITPNGRFKCNVRLCLSISDFHPDTWNPAWSVSTILTGLLSFMLEDQPTLGSLKTSTEAKRTHAMRSLSYNLANSTFCELFPDLAEELREVLKERMEAEEARKSTHTPSGSPAAPSTTMQTADNNSMMNHLVLLGAVAMLGYLAHTVLKHSQDLNG